MKVIEPRKRNNMAAVARKLYLKFKDARRPDGSKVWKDSMGISAVLSKGCLEGSMPCLRSSNRRIYILYEDAEDFIELYLKKRINSSGYTKTKLCDVVDQEEEEILESSGAINTQFGWVARLLGVDKLYSVLKDISNQLLVIQEQNEEIKKVWT